MGKKNKQAAKSGIPHKEAFMRMNFLFQAAHVHLSNQPSSPALARYYVHTMKSIARKLVLRLDPSIKRHTCKCCCTPLVPGLTATVRQRSHREKHHVITCLLCGTLKRYHTRKPPPSQASTNEAASSTMETGT